MIKCPKCGRVLDNKGNCSTCGHSIVTGISGASYPISSATWSSPSFSVIADLFGDDENAEKEKNE